jgi:endonuclease I
MSTISRVLRLAIVLLSATFAVFTALGSLRAARPHTEALAQVSRREIHEDIADHRRVPYTSNTVSDTWDVLSEADADPRQPKNVLTIYGNGSLPGGSSGNDVGWEREHLWPRSYGLSQNGVVCDLVFTDLHHLRPSEPELNQGQGNAPFDTDAERSNKPFDWCREPEKPGCVDVPLREIPPSDDLGRVNRTRPDTWEVWPGRRGDVARSLLYLDIRYEGGRHSVTGCAEPDLRLTDHRELIVTVPFTTGIVHMGVLSTLLDWHVEDPPDDAERRRNDVIEHYQGNRNPFVDHPDWVLAIWGDATGGGGGPPAVWLPWLGNAPPSPSAARAPARDPRYGLRFACCTRPLDHLVRTSGWRQ